MALPRNARFTQEHEWIKLEGDTAIVGITNYATEELGEIVFVELPEIGAEIEQMSEFGSVESVKTVSNLFMPMSGTITEVNKELVDNPSLINDSPFEDGWIVKLEITDQKEFDDLMSPEEYKNYLEGL